MNLYQKYRPLTWDEIVGNSFTVKELKQRSENNNFPQVIYFEGDTGQGKTTMQRLVAKSIVCTNKQEANPCNKCDQCKDINSEFFSLAVYEYNCSDIGIDEMRRIADLASKRSLTSDTKIFILDELQELSTAKAQKNILKLLEKKQKDTYFLLGAMNGSKVHRSIKNRAVTYRTEKLEIEPLAKHLGSICKKENITLDKDKMATLITIADASQGSARTAISYLERCINADLWTPEEVSKELGFVSDASLLNLCGLLCTGNVIFLETQMDETLLHNIRERLVITYKVMLGTELEPYHKSRIGGLATMLNIDAVSFTLDKLNDFFKYNYSDYLVLNTLFADCIRNNSKYYEKKSKRRRLES